ncbi:hypothetical protein BO71DRAFT_428876 [Aspergillus ellipticus CBS 707.79]|uniref:Uncharacterized protein n=1 Tax=Aspergillus ellipticus CBS 707.79 TaxID=1448320 RepID=A0A319DW37_9EURO|nr:hypothetical protein BO71DRAFT_428876 [Aspergillus ellipticus CBS 707.79]
MASLRGRLPLRASIFRGLDCGPRHALIPRGAFSTQAILGNQSNTPKDKPESDKAWKYDLSFKTQMAKTVLIVVLGMAGAMESWTLFRGIQSWWTGVPDEGDDI